MQNNLQEQLDSMTADQALDLMRQAMSAVSGTRECHLLLVKAEAVITALVKKALEESPPTDK